MTEYKKLTTPFTDEDLKDLKAGDNVLISGTIYVGRDTAHKRIVEAINKGEKLPLDLKGAVIYYAGPAPAKPGQPIGSVGPTTSYRMDPYAPKLIELGQKGMIGKGSRSKEVRDACVKYKAVYFAATGGAGALLAKRVKEAKIIAYEDLGPEALREIKVEDFPVVVVDDIYGNDLYEQGVSKYKEL